MAKIILTLDGTVLQELTLSKERITIGRRPHNDLVIDNLAISAEHAAIVTILSDSFLEDLNSTNGTQVNGQPVKKHFLQNGDVIELARFRIEYVTDLTSHVSASHQAGMGQAVVEPDSRNQAAIKILTGTSAGKEITLVKALTTVGRPGVQVAAITRRSQSYSITHVDGDAYPLVNGLSIGAGARALADGDVIDLSGTSMQFSLPHH